jgi:hypothetical protein
LTLHEFAWKVSLPQAFEHLTHTGRIRRDPCCLAYCGINADF